MKRLTLSKVARANLRVNRKAYISLFLGILTAVFLATATSLCAWGTVRGHEEQMAERVGWMDMYILGGNGGTDEQLRECGFFREIGHVTVNATVGDTQVCAGYYDETAERLMNRTLSAGRMPEKAGEIAAERSALFRAGQGGAEVGDTLTLTMNPIRGIAEERVFTLVGILNEQSEYLDTYNEEAGMRLPAMLVSPEETYTVGSAVVHRVLTYAPLITFNQVERKIPDLIGLAYGVSRENGSMVLYDSGWDRANQTLNRIMIWGVLGAALMLSACVGITSAMESLLARKTQDIGMLRAIGATRRQIRRIYGTEAWLLTATALPAGILAGMLAAWIVSRIAPDQVVFEMNLWLLIPILGLSALCVFAASRVPLHRASRQMPMGVLRDTGLLRRAGKIRSRKTFTASGLIAGRKTMLHPLRQLGAAGMTALTLICTLMLGELALGLRAGSGNEQCAFLLYGPGTVMQDEPFSQVIGENEAGVRADLKQLNGIEGVKETRSITRIRANLIMSEVPEYLRSVRYDRKMADGSVVMNRVGPLDEMWAGGDWMFYSDEELADARARKDEDWENAYNVQCADQLSLVQAKLGITDRIVPVSVFVADLDTDGLDGFVTDGAINPEKLDSGEQVLLYAPTLCVRNEEDALAITNWADPRDDLESEWDSVIRNDAFTAGMQLDLMEMTGEMADYDFLYGSEDVEEVEAMGARADWAGYYRPMETVNAKTTVGAVLSGSVILNEYYMGNFCVITTVRGAEALGLKLPIQEYIEVFLDGNPTQAEEEEIGEQVSQIALRNEMAMENHLQTRRNYMARKQRQMLLFAGLILLFFAVAVFMQVSGTARQIRADTKTIGTLRAVGANLKTLVGCYRLPVWICAAAGLVPGLLFYAVTRIPGLRLFSENHPLIMIPVMILLACCVAMACTAGIRGRLAQVTRQSIVDNIREL